MQIQDSHRICIAPMLRYTHRHFRYFMRLISKHVFLYTEMIAANALLRGDAERFLAFDPIEHPIALQLGGNDPASLAACARLIEAHGYDEINLNVGCPSERVQAGAFGACLMAEPALVADCVASMRQAVSIPITIKTRLGVQTNGKHAACAELIELAQQAGCKTFIIHARYAQLDKKSPKDNRKTALYYDEVYALKKHYSDLEIILNGNVEKMDAIATHLTKVDGVMIGRKACYDPYGLVDVDRLFFQDDHPILSREEIIEQYLSYAQKHLSPQVSQTMLLQPLQHLFYGLPNARTLRQTMEQEFSAKR
ncbi:MAG TPA: tRNA dihydrouridine(20/20a) synthase DusA [Coxiellaceae bacterium]|nr:tRNA dihydrouridine(20/20a) synthase DusA [Coxiellaceae bacterium]